MNVLTPLLLSTGLALCSFAPALHAQSSYTINLLVNTQDIQKQNAYQYCSFEGQADGTDPREYTIEVNPGDVINWTGSSSVSAGHSVQVTSINYHGGDNVFEKNVLKDTRDNPGRVSGVVQPGTEGFTEKYTIFFRVIVDGRALPGLYQMDPKVTVRPSIR